MLALAFPSGKNEMGPALHWTGANFLTCVLCWKESQFTRVKSPASQPNQLTLGFFFYFKNKSTLLEIKHLFHLAVNQFVMWHMF